MSDIHSEALDYFIEHQDELCEKYNGKELLMRGASVVGAFDTVHEATEEGRRLYGSEDFSLRTCIPGPEAYTTPNPHLYYDFKVIVTGKSKSTAGRFLHQERKREYGIYV